VTKYHQAINEKRGLKLIDKIFAGLETIPEFKNLSMDKQGEISIAVEKMIKGKI